MKLKFLAASLLLALSPVAAQNGDDEKDCHCNPDPHFRTWLNEYYDYHGGCDLILIQNSVLDLHIRTVEAASYSFIQQAAVKVGSDQLEIDMTTGTPQFRFNNGTATSSPPSSVGGAAFNSPVAQTYELLLGNGAWVRFDTYFSLSISAHGTAPGFSDSEGMGGKWNETGLIKRDGSTAATPLDLATDWHVMAGDPPLFTVFGTGENATCGEPTGLGSNCVFRDIGRQGIRETDNEVCIDGMPPVVPKRCQACIMQEQAAAACAGVPNENDRKNCVFDVETTGDVNSWPRAPFYSPFPIDPPVDDRCSAKIGNLCGFKGGTCVYDCVETANNQCVDGLCSERGQIGQGKCACKVATR